MDERVTKSEQRSGSAPYRLNVVIHGLWAIETNDNGIRMTTPHMHDHVVAAGKIGQPVNLMGSGTQKYVLEGVTPGMSKDFDPARTFLFPPLHHADATKVAVEIRLPYPTEIRSVRTFLTDGKPFFEGNRPETPPNHGTMVQVLVYDVIDREQLKLTGTNWKPDLHDDRHINLHLYAEPDRLPQHPEKHVEEAYKMLAEAFGLEIKPIRMINAPDPKDPDIPGLRVEDTMALFELNGPTVSPPTCDMFIFDNT